MLNLLQFDLPVLTAAMLIGILTGRWIFRGAGPAKQREDES